MQVEYIDSMPQGRQYVLRNERGETIAKNVAKGAVIALMRSRGRCFTEARDACDVAMAQGRMRAGA